MLQIWHKRRVAPKRAPRAHRASFPLVAAACALTLASCEGATVENKFDELEKRQTIFSDGDGGGAGVGSFLFGDDEQASAQGPGVAVNAFLWRAALDTVSFLPLSSADPFGGVIITDWHSETPGATERFKVNVIILSRDLVADGVSARVFREVRGDAASGWRSASVSADTASKLENAILQRARELRIAATAGG